MIDSLISAVGRSGARSYMARGVVEFRVIVSLSIQRLFTSVCLAVLACVAWLAGVASVHGEDGVRTFFDLPADTVERSIKRFATQSGLEILVPSDQVPGKTRTRAVHGEMTSRKALRVMLAGTDLVVLRDPRTGALAIKKETPSTDPDHADAPEDLADARKTSTGAGAPGRPNIVLVMADDMGWGETGYYNHPVLKTPHLDAMGSNGLRFDRFYAGAPVCSPTRATVLTGRSNDRTGVEDHGYALRRQERTIARALREAGYATAHFGKWHLNGIRGAGVPVLASDERSPGVFGFDQWLSATNYFDRNPILGGEKDFAEFEGDSSEVIVAEALKFIGEKHRTGKPSFTVIWYGSPHHPARAAEPDMAAFGSLDGTSRNHYGELVALDRSVGTLRKGLRDLNLAENTLVWFCSDNGGLKDITPGTVGGLRDFKGSLYEGGLRVPAIIEWPARIRQPRITRYPACTMDVFPTIAAIVHLPAEAMLEPIDGISLEPLFEREIAHRPTPIHFRYRGGAALVDNRYKLVSRLLAKARFGPFELYDLEADPHETKDLAELRPELMRQMVETQLRWNESVEASVAGHDYPGARVDPSDLIKPRSWTADPGYQPHWPRLLRRPEYRRTAESLKQR